MGVRWILQLFALGCARFVELISNFGGMRRSECTARHHTTDAKRVRRISSNAWTYVTLDANVNWIRTIRKEYALIHSMFVYRVERTYREMVRRCVLFAAEEKSTHQTINLLKLYLVKFTDSHLIKFKNDFNYVSTILCTKHLNKANVPKWL